MPVGAAIGGAVVTAGGSIIAGNQASRAQERAADRAADGTVEAARINADLFRETRDQNLALLQPWEQRGALGSYALTDLLLGTNYLPQATAQGVGAPSAPARTSGGALGAFAPAGTALAREDLAMPVGGPQGRGRLQYLRGRNDGALGGYAPTTPARPATPATPAAPAGTTAKDAWGRFREGTNYQWRLNEGMGALNQSYASNGAFESGAADKARIKYGQNFASNELANYMNLLAGQQAMGLSAAGAVAGVSTNYAGNVAAQNTQAANAAANAALVAGQGKANAWGAFGQGIGSLGGALYQYGMGQMAPQATYGAAGGPMMANPNPTPGATNVNWVGNW